MADAITSAGAVFAASFASASDSSGDAMLALGVAGVFGVSSGYGLIQVKRCRAAYEKRPGWSLEAMPAVM